MNGCHRSTLSDTNSTAIGTTLFIHTEHVIVQLFHNKYLGNALYGLRADFQCTDLLLALYEAQFLVLNGTINSTIN